MPASTTVRPTVRSVWYATATSALVPLEDGDPLIPSTLYAPRPQLQLERAVADIRGLDVTTRSFDELRFGRAALAAYLEAPSAGYFVKSPKSFLGAKGLSDEISARFVGVVTAMMANVKRHADAASGESIDEVVIGRPINFQGAGGEEENRNALEMLVECRAGGRIQTGRVSIRTDGCRHGIRGTTRSRRVRARARHRRWHHGLLVRARRPDAARID